MKVFKAMFFKKHFFFSRKEKVNESEICPECGEAELTNGWFCPYCGYPH